MMKSTLQNVNLMVETVVDLVSTQKSAQNVLALITLLAMDFPTLLLEMVSAMMEQIMLTVIMMVEIVVELVSTQNTV